MKKKTKLAAVLLSLSLAAAAAAGCGAAGSGSGRDVTGESTGTSSAGTSGGESAGMENAGTETSGADSIAAGTAAAEEVSWKQADESAASGTATITEQVLFDAENIKITAEGLEEGFLGVELKLLIENNSDRNITVQARNTSVNGYMVSTMLSSDVAAGKKANDSLIFETSSLEECGISTIASMEFNFHIFDADSWDEITDSGVIRIDTSASGSYTQTYDDTGEVLLDGGGIKIVSKGVSSEDSLFGPGIILYIENNTERDVTIQTRDVSVNGFMVDSSMSEDVAAGKKAVSAIQFFSSDLEKNSITKITNAEFSFHIFDSASWDTISDSDTLSLQF